MASYYVAKHCVTLLHLLGFLLLIIPWHLYCLTSLLHMATPDQQCRNSGMKLIVMREQNYVA